MASKPIPPILRLPAELATMICEELERDPVTGHHDLVTYSCTCKTIRAIAEKIIFSTVELLTKANITERGAVRYARLAQSRPRISSRRLQDVFLAPAPRVLEHMKSLAFHTYWNTSSVQVSITPPWMAVGFGRLLLKPNNLRRLEIDGNEQFAQQLQVFLAGVHGSRFLGVEDLTISMEYRFLIKLMPNLEKLSNRPREGFSRAFKEYNQAVTQEFLDLCGGLSKLRHLDFTIADVQRLDGLIIPAMPIQFLQISRERRRCPRPNFHKTEGRTPIGFILDMIRPHKNLESVHIPQEQDISMGFMDPAVHWANIFGYANALVAAIVVVKCPIITSINDYYTVDRCSERKKTILNPPGEVDSFCNENFEVISVHRGAEGNPAWFEDGDVDVTLPYDEERERGHLIVNTDCEALQQYTD